MTRRQLYVSARREVEKRRQAAETAAELRRRQLYEASPELAEAQANIARAGVAAARLAADGQGEAAAQKLAEMRALEKEKAALLAALGPAGEHLTPYYACEECNDTGFVNGAVCACVHREARRQRREEINRSGPLALCAFENFKLDYYPEKLEDGGVLVRPRDTMRGILRDCVDWAEEFGPRSQSLYMFGYAGLGKTHLALSIASRVLEAGGDVIYVSAQRAFATVAEREDGGELFTSMLETDLLVLDDLGTEYLNAYIRSRLYDLVNARMGRRPTIYTSNICSQEMLERRYDEKIASRLMGDCHLMRFWGEDIRQLRR